VNKSGQKTKQKGTYKWALKSSFETKMPSGRTAGEVFGQGVIITESHAHNVGSMFSSRVKVIIS
jgi:hypothetical protein